MGNAFHFGYVEEHLYVFRETFTGNGAATTFQLTSNVGNATFETGSWTVVNVETAMAADATKTTGAALYDSLLPLVRHKITVSSISATGLVTLNYAPMAENFYIWYWYDMEGDAIQDYYRDDYVSSMEADAGVTIASGITLDTAAFAGQLSVADDTVQKAMDTLDDHYHSNIFGVLKEPTGFANRTGSALAFADGTLTLTVTVVSGSYTYWINAVPYVISGTKTLPIADTEGTHVIYFDTDSALHEYVNPTIAQYLTVMTSKAIVATIYWDATNKQSVFFGEERHGCVMDGYTHEYLHYTRGLQYVSGMDLADFTIGNGSLDAHAQFSISSGSVADEDIGLTTGEKATATGLPILYRSGATGVWRKVTQTGFVCYQNPLGTTNRLMWNENTGATWQLTEVTESDFVIYHIFATTGYSQQLVSISGQAEYATLAAARTGATTEMNALLLGDLPALEMRPVASIIFQTDKDYGNTINARVVEVQSGGDDYVDWRSTDLPRGTAAFDSSLYVRVDGSAALSANWDAGSFKITAETFASDVATGTAPLTIASATLVTNLNVDQVDSLHAQTLTATSPITLSGVTSVLAAAGITIAHDATAGNVHVPTAGATGQLLIYGGASGTAAWTTATYPATTTAFRLLVSTAANTVSELAAGGSAGQYLRGATGAIPAWSTLTLPDTATAFKLAAYTATNVMTELAAVGATGQYLRAASGAIPAWSTLTLPDTATAFKLAAYTATNVMTELAAVGATGEYLAGATGAIPAWATLNQAAVAGLTTGSSPVFVTVKLSGLTDGYVPYHVSDAAGLANSHLLASATGLTVGSGGFTVDYGTTTAKRLTIKASTVDGSDDNWIAICSGGSSADTTGAYISFNGNEIASYGGNVNIFAGNVASAHIAFITGGLETGKFTFAGDLVLARGTISCSDLTDGYVPYHVSDAAGLANSVMKYIDANGMSIGVDDTTYGVLHMYSQATGSAQGGKILLYTGEDHDTTIVSFDIQAYEDDLCIGPSTDTDALKLDVNKDFFVTAGSIIISTASEYINFGAATQGSVGYGIRDNAGVMEVKSSGGAWAAIGSTTIANPFNIGTDDDTPGVVNIYSGGNTEAGGALRAFLPADQDSTIQYFQFGVAAETDDLIIGPDTDTDALKLDALKDLYITAGDLHVVGGSLYLTETADAQADVAAKGQFWVHDSTPNHPMFTNDAGTDLPLGVACSIHISPYVTSPSAITGTWSAVAYDAAWATAAYCYNSSHADGDEIVYTFYCGAGTYDIRILHGAGPNQPIVNHTLDGNALDSVDYYSAGVVGFVLSYGGALAGKVLTAGAHTIALKVNGKNASSSDYYALFMEIGITRVA